MATDPDVQVALKTLSKIQAQAYVGLFADATVAFNVWITDSAANVKAFGKLLDSVSQSTVTPAPAVNTTTGN